MAEKELRLSYAAIYSSISDWLMAAETTVQEDYQGIDYEIIDQKLALHMVCFLYLNYLFYFGLTLLSCF